MVRNVCHGVRAKLSTTSNMPNTVLQWIKWKGEVEVYLTIHYGHNPLRRDNLITAFNHRCPLDAYNWEDFKKWELEAVRQLSLGRLPHLPVDDAIEATMETY